MECILAAGIHTLDVGESHHEDAGTPDPCRIASFRIAGPLPAVEAMKTVPRLAFASLASAAALSASLILDRAPEARAVAEVFIEPGAVHVEWDLRGGSQPALQIQPSRARRPRRVAIAPPPDAAGKEIGLVVYHLGLPVSDLHYLAGTEIVELDWRDPWRSRMADTKLRRVYDSPLSVFLHVGRYQVRVEVVGRPAELGLPSPDPQRFRRTVEEFLRGRWTLRIDGREHSPPFDRCEFLERRVRTTRPAPPPSGERFRAAILGVTYRLRRENYPANVELEWRYFPPSAPRVVAAVTEDAFMEPATLTPARNVLRWSFTRSSKSAPPPAAPPPPAPWWRYLPWASPAALALLALLALRISRRRRRGAPLRRVDLAAAVVLGSVAVAGFAARHSTAPPEPAARRIVQALLENIYRACDQPTEERVYDALAESIAGEYLTDAYLEVRRELEIERTGGAQIRVREVRVEQATPAPLAGGPAFLCRARWTVAGSVAHWGHIHFRRNRYEGLLTVRPVQGRWKLTSMELTNEERLQTPGSTGGSRASR